MRTALALLLAGLVPPLVARFRPRPPERGYQQHMVPGLGGFLADLGGGSLILAGLVRLLRRR